MIKTINPYSTAMTAQIMSRYRPIAPKPEPASATSAAENDGIQKSPYLRNVWANLQARPTRTRKRGRTAAFGPPATVKRPRTCLRGLAPPYQVANPNSSGKNLAMHGFHHAGNNGLAQISLLPNLVPLKCGLDTAVTTLAESVALPLLRRGAAQYPVVNRGDHRVFIKGIDLNITADQTMPPEELDFLPQLKEPAKPRVISPRPVRPIHSSIVVKTIAAPADQGSQTLTLALAAEEVEAAVEAETMPAIVSDSNNKVRISNSAYKEMVGQPECCWLDFGAGACKRIGGEVLLRFVDCEVHVAAAHGFNGGVMIEWESEGKKKSVNAFCSVVKLASQSQTKDYQFLWKFYTSQE